MEIRPFKAYRFDPDVVKNVGECIAPPYDVIDEHFQQVLYDRNPCNVVRITRGKATPGDSDTDNVYTRAARDFAAFIASGVLKQDAAESVYAYVQDFQVSGRTLRRSGFVALAKLQDFGRGVQPHEKTLEGPKADRLKLTRATAAQFGQIFMLYDDAESVAEKIIQAAAARLPLVDFHDDDGVRHRLYPIDAPQDIAMLTGMMADKMTVIADGHHRYETALNYFAETKKPTAQYCMMTFVNMRNEGLIILPTHRLAAALEGFDVERLIREIEGDFDIQRFAFTTDADKPAARKKMFDTMRTLFDRGANAFGIYAGTPSFYTAALKNPAAMEAACPEMSRAARTLDANVLHRLVLQERLGIGEKELAHESHIDYIKDIGNAIEQSIRTVDSGKAQAVFFMNPTRIEQVKAVAAAGEKMPQKSTFFYPKIFTGLTIHKY
ncbi:MAG: DUF1015 domain-containing protein [Phycisphaerae bacterium]|nr:DUF1015 domain-containing protein [Phycisphaerae bacterium]